MTDQVGDSQSEATADEIAQCRTVFRRSAQAR
jgi:hypothetical protein